MDALALLNALDVIRNEKTYQERLNTLAEAKAQLDTSQYIVETVEIANARFEEANRLLEQARKRIADLDREIEDTRKQKLEDVVKLESALNIRTKELDQLTSKLNIKRQELLYDQAELLKAQKAVSLTSSEYEERRGILNKKEEHFTRKLEQLRKVIES